MGISVTTSRIGRKSVILPAGVEVKIIDQQLSAKGPKGQLAIKLDPFVNVTLKNNEINVQTQEENLKRITGTSKKTYKSIVGTIRANINNLVKGVSVGFEKKLLLVGVGYRAKIEGKVLALSLYFSHPTNFEIPKGITIETPTQTEIIIRGLDKAQVGEVAATIRKIRPPEPYKGKGVRYFDEKIVLKETKKK